MLDTEVPWLERAAGSLLGSVPDDPPPWSPPAPASGSLDRRAPTPPAPGSARCCFCARPLSMPTTQIAEQLGITTAAGHSSLQRAEARLDDLAPASEEIQSPKTPVGARCSTGTRRAFESARSRALPAVRRGGRVAARTRVGSRHGRSSG